MANLPIEERLLHYFLAMGAQRAESRTPPASISLILGGDRVHVVLLKNDALGQRGKIMESLLSIASLRNSPSLLYLAVPKLLGTTIDAQTFRAYGIGLLLYDERRIEEAVPPRLPQTPQPELVARDPDGVLLAELAALKSMYSEMEDQIAKLREELRNYRENSEPGTRMIEPTQRLQIMPMQRGFGTGEDQLPSFFVNNPWLDVLSKRGRDEAPHIAG